MKIMSEDESNGTNSSCLAKTPLPPRYRRIKKETLLSDEEKRLNHIASEQKRRQNIKLAYDQLCELIPSLREADTLSTAPNTAGKGEVHILGKTIEFIQEELAYHAQMEQQISAASVTALERPQILTYQQRSLTYTGFDVKWVPNSAKLVAMGQTARNTGIIEVLELNTGEVGEGEAGLNVVASSEKPVGVKCGTFGATTHQQRHLATGDFAGRLCIWDLERLDAPLYTTKAHSGMIHAIDGVGGLTGPGTGAPEIVTGSSDGHVRVWDPRQKDSVFDLSPAAESAPRECWSVAFGNSFNQDERIFAAGYETGDLKIVDLRTGKMLFQVNTGNGICALNFDRPDIKMNKLLVAGLENMVKAFDLRTINPSKGCAETSLPDSEKKMGSENSASTIWALRHLPQNREIFGISSGNGLLSLYKYNYPAQRVVTDEKDGKVGVPGSLEFLSDGIVASQPICAMDWNKSKLGLNATISYDQQIDKDWNHL